MDPLSNRRRNVEIKLLLAGLILSLSGLASAQYNNTSFYHPAEDGGCGVADVTIDWAPYVYYFYIPAMSNSVSMTLTSEGIWYDAKPYPYYGEYLTFSCNDGVISHDFANTNNFWYGY